MKNKIAVAGFILILIGAVLFLTGIFSLVGLILSIIGLVRVSKNPSIGGKKIAVAGVIIGAITLLVSVFALFFMSTELSLSASSPQSGKMEMMDSMELRAPAIAANATITGFERSVDNDANLIVYVDSFTHLGYDYYETNESTVVEAEYVLIRDNMRVIEPILKSGLVLDFEAYSYDLQDGVVDLTSQMSEYSLVSENGEIIAQTDLMTIDVKNKQGYVELPSVQSLVTVGKSVDCMAGHKGVCHPELHLEFVIDGVLHMTSLERGESLKAEVSHVQSIYLADSHTYEVYKNDHYSDYFRAEFFTVFESNYTKEKNDNYLTRPSLGRYCETTFTKKLDGFVTKCGIRSKINDIFNWILGPIINNENQYVVC